MTRRIYIKAGHATLLTSLLFSPTVILLLSPTILRAQVLDEVVVTAQRREQSMQEVPVSIEALSGADIREHGFRDMVQVSQFSTTLNVDPGVTSSIAIRGFGTSGSNLTMEQAVPTFVDGIHYGRGSQIQIPLLDVAQVEILKGPQPVYFGQNATAGAINIRTRRPTPEWEADVSVDRGNYAKASLEFGLGGPLTDTLGIRVAGKSDQSDGYITDVVTDDQVGAYETLVGRVVLEWLPGERLSMRTKFETGQVRRDIQPIALCLGNGTAVFAYQGGPPTGDGSSVLADPPHGSGWDVPTIPLDHDCFTEKGLSKGGPYFESPPHIRERFSNQPGTIDIRSAAEGVTQALGTSPSIQGYDDIDSTTGLFDLTYDLTDDIAINWLTGYNTYWRDTNNNTIDGPFAHDLKSREENFDQWSSELRFESATGGTLEWAAGLFWQRHEYDIDSMTPRGNVRRGLSYYVATEKTEWRSAFATLTVNFLDDRAAIDIGGRFSQIDKSTSIEGWGAMWIFDVEPVSAGNRGPDHPDGTPGRVPYNYYKVDPNQDFVYLAPGVDTDNLWAFPWLGPHGRQVPVEWQGVAPVGATELDNRIRENVETAGQSPSYLINSDGSDFDPQVVIRYSPIDTMSIYAKWARAFKAGGADTGSTSLSPTAAEATFGPEFAETYELGVKGTLMENSFRYDVTLFEVEISDLQVSSSIPNPENPSLNVNAGAQRVRGVEINTLYAVSDQWTVGLGAAFLDGIMSEFIGAGCTAEEFTGAPESGCDPVTERIDRTGSEAPKSPDYKFVLNSHYWMPILGDRFALNFDVMGYVSDGYITDVGGFSKVIKMNKHGDMNLSVGLSDAEETWRVSAYVRNLFEARPSYNPEFDPIADPENQLNPQGIVGTTLNSTAFTSYGVKLDYYFR